MIKLILLHNNFEGQSMNIMCIGIYQFLLTTMFYYESSFFILVFLCPLENKFKFFKENKINVVSFM